MHLHNRQAPKNYKNFDLFLAAKRKIAIIHQLFKPSPPELKGTEFYK